MRLVAHRNQKLTSVVSCPAKSFVSPATMSDKKRKAPSAVKEPSAKQQKLAPVKEEKGRAGGWLQDHLKQQRTEKKEMKFNKKRIRFISETEKIKQGTKGVLYWMLRDQRVQGNHLKTTNSSAAGEIFGLCFVHVSVGNMF